MITYELDLTDWILLMAIFLVYKEQMEKLGLLDNFNKGNELHNKFCEAKKILLIGEEEKNEEEI